jgi:tetratricopeptide (TPR) repeat protein
MRYNHLTVTLLTFFSIFFFPVVLLGQTDELRAATGLPIQIGQPAVFGQVVIKRLSPGERKPTIHVTMLEGGSQVGRVQANDAGYYYFLEMPRTTATLVFEINNFEVGRAVLAVAAGASRNLRQDFTVDWEEFKKVSHLGVVSAVYPRSEEAERAFEAAMKSSREKNNQKAIAEFNAILEKDPKDFVAWTELGTVFFRMNSFENAEACYFKAIELKKDFLPALLNLGKLYLGRQRADDAILVLSNAVNSAPQNADARHYLGEAYLLAKKGSLAVPQLREAIRLAPGEKAELHLRLADLFNAAGGKKLAADEYKEFLKKRPDHPDRERLEKYIRENQ